MRKKFRENYWTPAPHARAPALRGSNLSPRLDRRPPHGELRHPSPQAPYTTKNTFRILEKTRRNLPYGSQSQHDKYTHPVPAHNNTLLLRRFSRRVIALQHESYTRPAQSVGTRSRSTKRELRMNLVRGQARSSSLMNCSAYLKTLLKSKCVFRRPPKESTPPLEPWSSTPISQLGTGL